MEIRVVDPKRFHFVSGSKFWSNEKFKLKLDQFYLKIYGTGTYLCLWKDPYPVPRLTFNTRSGVPLAAVPSPPLSFSESPPPKRGYPTHPPITSSPAFGSEGI